ncbi:MAG: YqiA/YcfP family alpha/beta fold hydrolase [SAR324 cluster bacterium]|nr:YqiA/YcfP family alpha/beta fold hydrolase [SAR324 cluster bacterium]
MIKVNHPVFFFHGLKGSPLGIKSTFLKSQINGIKLPNLSEDLTERMEKVRGLITEPSYIIGSSLGGLTAILFAQESPHLIKGLVLIAPAVGFFDASLYPQKYLDLLPSLRVPSSIPTEILAGQNDELIPIKTIEALANRSPHTRLTVVRDDHSMNANLEFIIEKFELVSKV